MEPSLISLPYAEQVDSDVEASVSRLFTFEPWDRDQTQAGYAVREKLVEAYLAILRNVPPSPSRTRALNMLTDCRMLANQAITFRGEV